MNTGAQFCPLEFSINEHKLKVISTDGNPVEPTLVRSFILFPGERVDFVLEATKKPNKTYWIKVKGHADCEDSKIYQTAILMYDDSDATNLNSIQLPNEKITYENSGRTPCPGLVRLYLYIIFLHYSTIQN
jgi:FtsP/CotA-like multicopper oxidase with cupredoxin domain